MCNDFLNIKVEIPVYVSHIQQGLTKSPDWPQSPDFPSLIYQVLRLQMCAIRTSFTISKTVPMFTVTYPTFLESIQILHIDSTFSSYIKWYQAPYKLKDTKIT